MKVVSDMSQKTNVKFADESNLTSVVCDNQIDPTRVLHDSSVYDIKEFFSRPVVVDYEVPVGGGIFFQKLDPWSIFFEDPRVANRINNYQLLSCDLKVKFVLNGNKFYQGAIAATYLPLAVYDTLSQSRELVPEDFVQASQQPMVFMEPTDSSGSELTLPFLFHNNKIKIPTSEWNTMGEMTLRAISNFKHSNGSTQPVTLSLFIYAENVELDVLTSVNSSTLTPQSGNDECTIPKYESQGQLTEQDEANTKGMVSGPATALAKVANTLSSIPMIAPYAKATSIGASAVAKIAKNFGYCAPPLTKAIEPYRPTSNNDVSTCTTPKFVRKFTVDDKQELTIDPRISGYGAKDDMGLASIASRQSYLTKFTWPISAVSNDLLWNCRVTPVVWAEDTNVPPGFHFPACAMAAMPFQYWTGTMVYRFQIIKSAFHKGRIKLVYDPNFNASSDQYNVNQIQVFDITEKNDFSIEIGIGQDRTFLEHHDPGLDSVTELYSTTEYAFTDRTNGTLGVYVQNALTSPNDAVNNDIEVLVYVSMKDDCQFAAPSDKFQNFVFKPQSGCEDCTIPKYKSQGELTEISNQMDPEHMQADELAAGTNIDDNVNLVFFGEKIDSFRTLLKRYNLHTVLTSPTNANPFLHRGRRHMFPYLRGAVLGSVDNSINGADSYNYCNTLLLHWVTAAFSGWRGSIRWNLTAVNRTGSNRALQYSIARCGPGQAYARAQEDWSGGALTFSEKRRQHLTSNGPLPSPDGLLPLTTGGLMEAGYNNPTVEFEVPYYSNFRFVPGKQEDYTSDNIFACGYDYRIFMQGDASSRIMTSCAAGEDFQVFGFTGLPPMYFEASPPDS